MAITVDWSNRIINIPRADMIIIQSTPTEVRELDMNTFRLVLKDLEDDEAGMVYPDTHRHIAPISVGGVTLARVVEIINNYTVTFEDGQYAVNLKGANTNLADVSNVNQVSIRSSNSAGLQDLSTILKASYNGVVVVDVVYGQSGQDIPIGTRSTPVDNFGDALAICNKLGISVIQLVRSCTIDQYDFSDGFEFVGDNTVTVVVTVDITANVDNCIFKNLTLQGDLDGHSLIKECLILNINDFYGIMNGCALNGIVTITNGQQATIANCFSNVTNTTYATVNMGGGGTLALRGYNGGLTLSNYNGNGYISMDFASGRLNIDTDVTAGHVYVRGDCTITDNSTGSAVIHDLTTHADLMVINSGVKKSSILVPHTQDLP